MRFRANSSCELLVSLAFVLAVSASACGGNGIIEAGESGTGSETGDAESGEDDDGCHVGAEGCPCTGGGACDPGLICESGSCVPAGTTGDGDATTGGACDSDVYIEIDADEASDKTGWDDATSMISPEEGDILVIASQGANNVTFDVDVPCDDTYHVWVRGWEQGSQDSFFAQTDGQPDPGLIFELDCSEGPQETRYLWRELNQRDFNAGLCEYIADPWTQDWTVGPHTVSLQFRESQAISAIVVTNTLDQPPEP